MRAPLFLLLLTAMALRVPGADEVTPAIITDRVLAYAPAPVDNPLKGLVPYSRRGQGFPCSLEFNYLPLGELMSGPSEFTWDPLERLLDDVASRGRQTVFRVWLEYPGRTGGIPRYLLDGGLRTYRYTNTNTQPLPPTPVITPDYRDPRLRRALTNFIHALGARYDGDPRVGFLTAGLLGTWGEWHTHPRTDLWAPPEVQREIMDAYEAAFHRTPVLLRYPAGPQEARYADTSSRRLGYHDDSFAWATCHTGKKSEAWFFETRMRAAGEAVLQRWRSQPIGGEIRPEAWTCVWDDPPCVPAGQEFLRCVEATHVTWLMDSGTFGRGAFGRRLTPAALERATNAVRRMGYELQATRIRLGFSAPGSSLWVGLSLTNHGVAPFYQAWPVELAVSGRDGSMTAWPTEVDLRRTLPGEPIEWRFEVPRTRLPPNAGQLLLRVVNPLPGGRPFRFANVNQDVSVPGWLTLADLAAPPP